MEMLGAPLPNAPGMCGPRSRGRRGPGDQESRNLGSEGQPEGRPYSPSAPMDTSLTPLLAMKSRALLTLEILCTLILPLSGLARRSPEYRWGGRCYYPRAGAALTTPPSRAHLRRTHTCAPWVRASVTQQGVSGSAHHGSPFLHLRRNCYTHSTILYEAPNVCQGLGWVPGIPGVNKTISCPHILMAEEEGGRRMRRPRVAGEGL